MAKILIVDTDSGKVQRFTGGRFYFVPGLILTVGLFLGWALQSYAPQVLKSKADQFQLEQLNKEEYSRELAQRREVDQALLESRWALDALSKQLGQMQARMVRLESLGKRLTEVASLEEGEFDFNEFPAMGGPQGLSSEVTSIDIVGDLRSLAAQLDSREQQLGVMEALFREDSVTAELLPSGRPIRKGWLSSRYGYRVDPFSGQREFHAGVDFAGKAGTEILAVASGIVSWSGAKRGYGQLVEIDHGKGTVTKYAHNKTLLVSAGDLVQKGQALALMGSTGRSTGPHVHFEVVQNGKTENPTKFLLSRNVR